MKENSNVLCTQTKQNVSWCIFLKSNRMNNDKNAYKCIYLCS